MRTTIELPDFLFREVKSTAAKQGVRLKDYITDALRDKLAQSPSPAQKPWMEFCGIAAKDPDLLAEFDQIDKIVEENFGQIEVEDWK